MQQPTELADIVGPVCETGDIFAQGRLMPLPHAGDLLAFRSAGAYGATMASTYNSRPLLAEAMVNGKDHAVIRPRQTYEELLGRDKLPEWLDWERNAVRTVLVAEGVRLIAKASRPERERLKNNEYPARRHTAVRGSNWHSRARSPRRICPGW